MSKDNLKRQKRNDRMEDFCNLQDQSFISTQNKKTPFLKTKTKRQSIETEQNM